MLFVPKVKCKKLYLWLFSFAIEDNNHNLSINVFKTVFILIGCLIVNAVLIRHQQHLPLLCNIEKLMSRLWILFVTDMKTQNHIQGSPDGHTAPTLCKAWPSVDSSLAVMSTLYTTPSKSTNTHTCTQFPRGWWISAATLLCQPVIRRPVPAAFAYLAPDLSSPCQGVRTH